MIALALGLMMAAAPEAATPDPFAPALKGKVQCYAPNPQRKTCQSIGGYARTPGGDYQNTAIVLLSPSPVIVMETVAPVTARRGAICGVLTRRDVATTRFLVDGQPADAAQAERLHAAVAQAEASMFNHEICTAEAVVNGTPMAQVSVDGTRNPALDQPMIWVSPGDGFKVAP